MYKCRVPGYKRTLLLVLYAPQVTALTYVQVQNECVTNVRMLLEVLEAEEAEEAEEELHEPDPSLPTYPAHRLHQVSQPPRSAGIATWFLLMMVSLSGGRSSSSGSSSSSSSSRWERQCSEAALERLKCLVSTEASMNSNFVQSLSSE